jgi:hypothetical protein
MHEMPRFLVMGLVIDPLRIDKTLNQSVAGNGGLQPQRKKRSKNRARENEIHGGRMPPLQA